MLSELTNFQDGYYRLFHKLKGFKKSLPGTVYRHDKRIFSKAEIRAMNTIVNGGKSEEELYALEKELIAMQELLAKQVADLNNAPPKPSAPKPVQTVIEATAEPIWGEEVSHA